MVSPTSSSFYTDGEQYAEADVVPNDYTPANVPSQAPSSLFPNGTAYDALANVEDVVAEINSLLSQTQTAEADATVQAANALTSANASHASEVASASSATAAANSATGSATSAANAHTSEVNAAASNTNAATSASAASTSAANALASANAANTSAGNAAASATSAASSATAANTSKTNAATSETNAANSATAAATSAANAASAVQAAAGTATPLVDGTAAVGTSTKWAHEDHKHPVDTATPDARIANAAGTATPLVNGTAAVGTGTKWAHEDHVHPTDTSRAANTPFVASGASHAAGLVPDPGATAGSTKFLREDATWAVPAGSGGGGGHGQCILTLTGGNLVLTPKNGNALKVNGVTCTVPDAGVSLAATGFTPNANYYIYAVATAGVITSLEASATAYAVSTAAGNNGVVIKSGDNTRTLVGFARCITGPAWTDTPAQRYVRSWFNDPGIFSLNNFTATRTTASTTFIEVNTEIRIEALIWSGETWDVSQFVSGFFNNTTNSNNWSGIAFNGVTPEKNGVLTTIIGAIGGTAFGAGATAPKSGLTEGYNYATLVGKCDAGSASWSSSADGNRTVMKGYARR